MNSSGLPHVPFMVTSTLQPNSEQESNRTIQTLQYIFYPIGAVAILLTAAALVLFIEQHWLFILICWGVNSKARLFL